MMGWDGQGVPGRAKLEELNVGWIWDLLTDPGDSRFEAAR